MATNDITKLTKVELIALLGKRNAELNALRVQVSTLEGELALRPRAAVPQGGVLIERHGQRVTKRWSAA
jgi:hypothetical protein